LHSSLTLLRVIIGDNTEIKEFVVINKPTDKVTSVGKDCYIMSHVFIGHDCDRDEYIKFMNNNGVQTGIHYPTALPDLECFKKFYTNCENARLFCKSCVSLPMFPYMTDEEVIFTLGSRRNFYHRGEYIFHLPIDYPVCRLILCAKEQDLVRFEKRWVS